MRSLIIKITLALILGGFFILPIFQQFQPFIRYKSLDGEYTILDKPKFLWNNWFQGEFQEKCQDYINDNIGFRPWFIRTYNQVYYSLFSSSANNKIIKGREGYLYEKIYIESYLGLDYIGDKRMDTLFYKMNNLRDTLNKLNKELIIIIAPSKADFFPEFIPKSYLNLQKKNTNYKEIRTRLSKFSYPFIDFNLWFKSVKDSGDYTLFNNNGIHWSNYAEFLVMDSISNYVSKTLDKSLRRPVLDSLFEVKSKDTYRDNDIGKALNLFWIKDDLKLGKPVFHFEKPKDSLRAMVIGDSFVWGLYNMELCNMVFDRGEFWYYFHNVYPEDYSEGGNIPKFVPLLDIKQEIDKFDIIIIIQTPPNLVYLGFGFIERAYDLFYISGDGIDRKSDRTKYYIEVIKADKKWYNLIKSKAIKDNIPIEDALRRDAEFMANQR